jgi:arylsulfatase A-like enzyme
VSKPNLLIFMTDHQRGDTVLPEHPAAMPNVSRLAEQGITFSQTFCPSPHCCPARATFWTGLYPSRHGVWNNICNDQALSRGLNPGVRVWSEHLAEAGYQMAWSGKWHVSTRTTPKDHGWRELCVGGHKPQEHATVWEQYQRLAEQPEPAERGEGEILRPGYPGFRLYGTRPDDGQHGDERVVSLALDELPALADSGDPWALFIGCSGPHDPYIVPQRFLDLYDLDDVPLPPSYGQDLSGKPRIVQRMHHQIFGQLSQREVREGIRHFWAYCSFLDELFGNVLAALDETGQAEDTLVLYASDHGDYVGEHGLFAKGIPCYRGAYHVPAVLRWPNGIERPGRRVEQFVSLADFAPTFTELAGQQPDPDLTGRSLAPFLRGETPGDWRDAIFTQCNGVELYFTQRSVMTRSHKYVWNGFDFDELYDLEADPHETRNVNDDPAYAEVKHNLVRRLWRFAHRERDSAINAYITVALAPYGPAEAFREEDNPR